MHRLSDIDCCFGFSDIKNPKHVSGFDVKKPEKIKKMIFKSTHLGRIFNASRLLQANHPILKSSPSQILHKCTISRRCNSYYSRRISELNSAEHEQPSDGDEKSFKLSIDDAKLYDDHIRLSVMQRAALSVGSAFMALADPYRDGKI